MYVSLTALVGNYMYLSPMDSRCKGLIELLKEIQLVVTEWEREKKKVTVQLKSLLNLQEQLDTSQRCSTAGSTAGSLGVLSTIPDIIVKLQGQIISSMERAHKFIERDRNSMSRLITRLHNKSKSAENVFKEIIDSYGLEISLSRTAESFSLSDYMKWIQDIKYVLCKDWQEMKDKLRDIQYTSDSINKVYTTWERGGTGLAEYHHLITYTLEQHCIKR